jgi:hypothetical protein
MILESYPMLLDGETEVKNEKELLRMEDGPLMNGGQSVQYLIVHCSATRVTKDYTEEQLLKDHKARGFRTVGYHFYIRKSGVVTPFRKLLEVGAHCRPWNRCSIGICYEGGSGCQREAGGYADAGAGRGARCAVDSAAQDVPPGEDPWSPRHAEHGAQELPLLRCPGQPGVY